jgi:hypothetical protein
MDQKFNQLAELSKDFTGLDIRYSRSRRREIINIKCAIVNVMRRYHSRTITQIGGLLNIHHTTVIHHLKDHPNRYRDIDDYADLYDHLCKHIVDSSELLSTEKILSMMRSVMAV